LEILFPSIFEALTGNKDKPLDSIADIIAENESELNFDDSKIPFSTQNPLIGEDESELKESK